jgi:hypothetical protein
VRGELEGPDRAQTQAADTLTLTLRGGQRVAVKQNPQALKQQGGGGAAAGVRVGACAWDGALVLAAWADAQPEGAFARARVVELGAGVGLAGLVLARLGAAAVTLTDRPQALAFSRMSAGKNGLLAPPAAPGAGAALPPPAPAAGPCVRVEPLEWGAPGCADAVARLAAGGVDLVVACDCIYPGTYVEAGGAPPDAREFMAAAAGLLAASPSGRALVTFETRSDELRAALLGAAGRAFERVAPLPLECLPPAFRLPHIEVYELSGVRQAP